MNTDIGVHLVPFLLTLVVLVGIVLLEMTFVRRVHDSWHRK